MSTLVNPLASFQAAQSNVQGLQDMRQLAQARAQQMQLGQQEYKLNDLKLRAANQDFEESDAINKALSSNTGTDGQLNRQGVINSLSQQGKGKAAAGLLSGWQKQDADKAKSDAETQKFQIDNALNHVKLTGQLLQGVNDPASYAVARAKAMATGNFKPNEIPEQYDPNFVQQALNQTMTQKDTLEAHAKFLDQQLRGLEIGATQARDAETVRYHAVESKQRQQEIGIQGARVAVERQKVALSKGDPHAAAQLLVDGDATLSELKARGSTPEFIAQTLKEARAISGGKFNAQSDEAEFAVAKSPTNVAFFGSANSLIDKGGTLDQLADAAKDIPGGKIPALNNLADWEKAATGSGPIAKYASIALGVADDYAKVMGGGQGSDASRMQALNLVGAKQSPDQRAGSISGIRGSVTSQTNSRIGKNRVLRRMYGSELTPAATGSKAQSGGFDWNAHPEAK